MGIGLGLNFSKKKAKSSTDLTKTEDTTQARSESTNSTQASQSSTTQQNQSTGSSTSTQSGTQTSDSQKVGGLTGSTSLFADDILGSLEGKVSGLLGSVNPATVNQSAFNAEDFVNSTVGAAAAKSQDSLDQIQGALGDTIGANPLNSSMGSLLLSRARSDVDASLAGVRANAQQTAQGIETARNQVQLAAGSQGMDMLTQLLGALKGGVQNTSQATTEGTTGSSTTSQTGTTNTSESSTQQSNTQAMQTIQQLVDALLTGTTKTVGSEKTKSSGLDIGGSASLGK